jgi:hypothetical protein
MSAKLKFFVILIFSIFSTVVGVYMIQRQPTKLTIGTANGQQKILPVENSSYEPVAYPERSHYKTIPLEGVNSLLQGSDPETLALNILYDVKSLSGKPLVEVTYPQTNRALVTVTKLKQLKNHSASVIKYRVEMSRFGRSLLVSSPPVWEVIWAGSQVQCSSKTTAQIKFIQDCD